MQAVARDLAIWTPLPYTEKVGFPPNPAGKRPVTSECVASETTARYYECFQPFPVWL